MIPTATPWALQALDTSTASVRRYAGLLFWVPLVANLIRKLPPVVVRVLTLLDMLLVVLPPWAYFFFARWTGRFLAPREFARLYGQSIAYTWHHALHTRAGTGPLFIQWSSGPVRRSPGVERPDWSPRGSCGTCRNCCTTAWLPEEKRVSCPFLRANGGCGIYGGVYWDYFNCGRYPAMPQAVAYYTCPRFKDEKASAELHAPAARCADASKLADAKLVQLQPSRPLRRARAR